MANATQVPPRWRPMAEAVFDGLRTGSPIDLWHQATGTVHRATVRGFHRGESMVAVLADGERVIDLTIASDDDAEYFPPRSDDGAWVAVVDCDAQWAPETASERQAAEQRMTNAYYARPLAAHPYTADCDLPAVLRASNKLATLAGRVTQLEDRQGQFANFLQTLPQAAVWEQLHDQILGLVAENEELRNRLRALELRRAS